MKTISGETICNKEFILMNVHIHIIENNCEILQNDEQYVIVTKNAIFTNYFNFTYCNTFTTH